MAKRMSKKGKRIGRPPGKKTRNKEAEAEKEKIKKKRGSRAPHKEGCECAICKQNRRMEAEAKEEKPKKDEPEKVEPEQDEPKKDEPKKVEPEQDEPKKETPDEKKIIENYLQNLPPDKFLTTFEPSTVKVLHEKWNNVLKLFPSETPEGTGDALVNHALRVYLKDV